MAGTSVIQALCHFPSPRRHATSYEKSSTATVRTGRTLCKPPRRVKLRRTRGGGWVCVPGTENRQPREAGVSRERGCTPCSPTLKTGEERVNTDASRAFIGSYELILLQRKASPSSATSSSASPSSDIVIVFHRRSHTACEGEPFT